ncbi:hypothetical protein F4805DRAFT_462585 [Annulohypoxylon moriforme]|nr:hypothetical protein F4805DRAFT_462585 [Annulohypoxylon moriforme]
MEPGKQSRNTQATLVHQYKIPETCSSRSTSPRLDTSSYTTSATSIDTSHSNFTPNDNEEELCSALGRDYTRSLNREAGKSPLENSSDDLLVTKNHNSSQRTFTSRPSRQSKRREIVILNNEKTQQPSHSSPKRRSIAPCKEQGDSSSYTGVYPHDSSRVTRSHLHVNLLATTNSPHVINQDPDSASGKDVVFKCVQKSTGHSVATRTEGKIKAKEWSDRQPRPVALPEIIHASVRPSKGTVCELGQGSLESIRRSDSPSNRAKPIPIHSLRTSPIAILKKIEQEDSISGLLNEQYNHTKYQQESSYRGGLQVVHSSTVQCQDGNPNDTPTTASQGSQNTNSLGLYHIGETQFSENRKRKTRRGSSGNNSGGDSEEEEPRQLRTRGGKGKAAGLRYLACPYFKHDPKKYSGREWGSCCGPGWFTVHRVKEHLYRCHRQPKYRCLRCGQHFEEEKTLENHSRETKACIVQDKKLLDGFDSKQEIMLRSRKKPKPRTDLSEPEKWKLIYKILFPDVLEEKIPTAFYDYTENLLVAAGDYEEFVLREIPNGDFRAILEHDFETIFKITDDSSKRDAVQWYCETQRKLLDIFRNTSQAGTSLPSTSATPGPSAIDTTDAHTPPPFSDNVSHESPTALATVPEYTPDNYNQFEGLSPLEDFNFHNYPYEITIEGTKLVDSAYESMSVKDQT